MNLGLENLISRHSEPVMSDAERANIMLELKDDIDECRDMMDQCNKLEMIENIAEILESADENDVSLLNFVREDLEAIGVDTTNNRTAFEAIGIAVGAVLKVADSILIIIGTLIILNVIGGFIRFIFKIQKSIRDLKKNYDELMEGGTTLPQEVVDEANKVRLNVPNANDLINHVTALHKAVGPMEKLLSADPDTSVENLDKLITELEGFVPTTWLMSTTTTLDRAGWTPKTLVTGITHMLKVLDVMTDPKRLVKAEKDAMARIKASKKSDLSDKSLTKEQKKEIKNKSDALKERVETIIDNFRESYYDTASELATVTKVYADAKKAVAKRANQ